MSFTSSSYDNNTVLVQYGSVFVQVQLICTILFFFFWIGIQQFYHKKWKGIYKRRNRRWNRFFFFFDRLRRRNWEIDRSGKRIIPLPSLSFFFSSPSSSFFRMQEKEKLGGYFKYQGTLSRSSAIQLSSSMLLDGEHLAHPRKSKFEIGSRCWTGRSSGRALLLPILPILNLN